MELVSLHHGDLTPQIIQDDLSLRHSLNCMNLTYLNRGLPNIQYLYDVDGPTVFSLVVYRLSEFHHHCEQYIELWLVCIVFVLFYSLLGMSYPRLKNQPCSDLWKSFWNPDWFRADGLGLFLSSSSIFSFPRIKNLWSSKLTVQNDHWKWPPVLTVQN